MRKIIFATFIGVIFCMNGNAQDWHYSLEEHSKSHISKVTGNGETEGKQFRAILELAINCTNKRQVIIKYSILEISKLKEFNFDDFAGPTARVGNRKMLTVKIKSPQREFSFIPSVAGGYGYFPFSGGYKSPPISDGFTFSFYGENNGKSNISKLLKSVLSGASKISLTLQSYSDRKKTLYTDFSTTGASNAITQMLKGCGSL
jgi:hypothetical protein